MVTGQCQRLPSPIYIHTCMAVPSAHKPPLQLQARNKAKNTSPLLCPPPVRPRSMAMAAAVLVAIALPVSLALLLVAKAVWVTVSCYYLTPARIRRVLASQGVRGPPPRPLVGNLRDVSALVAESTAADMASLSHDIVARLLPHYVLWSNTYGECSSAVRRRRSTIGSTLTPATWVRACREAVRVLVRERAAGVRDGGRHGAGAPVVAARARHRQVVAAAAGRQALHRPWPPHGQRRHLVAPAPRRRAGVHGRPAQGEGGAHGGVHEADGAGAEGCGGEVRERGGDRRAHGEARRRRDRAHRVRHELRDRQEDLPPHRGAPAPHRPLQPLPLGPRQPVFSEQVQERDKAAERRAGAAAQGVHRPEPGDRRRGPDAVGVAVRPWPPRHAAGRDGEEGGRRQWRRRGRVRRPDDDRRVQDLLLRRPRDVGAAPHLGHHAARHAPGVAGQGARRGRRRLRRRRAVAGQPPEARRAPDGDQRDAAAVPAGDAAAADGVRGHRARRGRAPGAEWRVGVDPGARHPPRRGRVGPRRARVQAGQVRAGTAAAAGGGVPAVRRRAAQLRRAGVRHGGGQGRARHAPLQLPLRHLRRVPARAGERAHAPATPRRARPPPAAAAAAPIGGHGVFFLDYNFGNFFFHFFELRENFVVLLIRVTQCFGRVRKFYRQLMFL
ncbi:Os08g0429800 [Oryza sativa Japonica Group]|uniref:Os08g0429800 protein n=1 Tax=Oryza sativa subsp. japonica TaxID=39947 RepID=A0A0P0XG80_ORYSJ|nr:hypothetical protein EE612_044425 [Oryza sativa]BAT05536.1 Os08g0429800 [Oryza sativa Japonica Group]